jgi:hypothetical protein
MFSEMRFRIANKFRPSPPHPHFEVIILIYLVCTDDVNLLGGDTIKRNTQTLIDASKEVGLEVNTEN